MPDFVIYDVGWDKDCLLNTWEGDRVEPIPFAKMKGHDYWTDRPVDESYSQYLLRFQTRKQYLPYRRFVRDWSFQNSSEVPIWERLRRNGD